MPRRNLPLMVALLSLCLVTGVAVAADAVGWRTDGTSRYPTARTVTEWSADKNVIWKTPIDKWSNASPVVVGDRIFICAEPDRLICINAADGKVLWDKSNSYKDVLTADEGGGKGQTAEAKKQLADLRKRQGELEQRLKNDKSDAAARKDLADVRRKVKSLSAEGEGGRDMKMPGTADVNGYSSSTPVSDGKHVWMVFGSGVVVCYDMDGRRIWGRVVQRPTHGWGHCASPALADGKLVVVVIDAFGLDAETGKEVWRAKSAVRWGSPQLAKIGGKSVVVTANGEIIRVSDGATLASGIIGLDYNSPMVADGTAYFIQDGGKAVKLPDRVNGDKIDAKPAWTAHIAGDRYYSTPLLHEGLLYAVNLNGIFTVIDAANGKPVYEKHLKLGGGTVYPSIVLAGQNLLVSIDNGTTMVLATGRQYKEIARNKLEEFRTTPVCVGDRMYIRGLKHMWCIGGK